MKDVGRVLYADIPKILADSPILSAVFSISVVLFDILYGQYTFVRPGMTLIALLVVTDWIGGFTAAKKDGIDTSAYGIEGIFRTVLLLLVPAIAHHFDSFFMTQGLVTYFVLAALARHLTKSVIANVHRSGWTQWVPVEVLDKLVAWVEDELAHKEARAERRYNEIHPKKDEGGEK